MTYTATCDIDPAATGTLSNTATIAGTVTDPAPGNESATDSDTVLAPEADLAITKTDGVTSAVPGGTVTYTIVASNAGPSTEPAGTVTDTFPAPLACTWTSVAAGGATGNTAASAGDLAETLALPPGSSVTYTATCDIDPAATGTLSNTATIAGTTTDPAPGDESATDADTVLSTEADLVLTKTAEPGTVGAGEVVTFRLGVENLGPSDATGVTVEDPLPTGLSFVDSASGCLEVGGIVTCSIGTLVAGGEVEESFRALVAPDRVDPISNTASVVGNELDPTPGNDAASAAVAVGPLALVIPVGGPVGSSLLVALLAWIAVAVLRRR